MDLTNLNKNRKERRKNNPIELGTLMFGKVPPQARDVESVVLGAILIDRAAFDTVIEILKPECFYVEAHQKIFSAMINLSEKNSPIDTLTVLEELRFLEYLDVVGGPHYLIQLTKGIVSSANIQAHCRIIIQKYMSREIIRVGGEMIADGYEDNTDAFQLLDKSEREILRINPLTKKGFNKVEKGLIEVIRTIENLRNTDNELTGINTGYRAINQLTAGWQQPDLIILAARPSVGKTAFALNLARNAIKYDKIPVGFFSMEMSEAQLIQRLVSMESQIELSKITRGRVNDDEMKIIYDQGAKIISSMPLYIDDTPALAIYELRNKVRKMVKEYGVKIVFIDYLQLMSGIENSRSDNREQEVSKISRDLKSLCKEMKMPIIALSQLSRQVESRKAGDKMPVLSDLRESGAIEQDADIVMFMYRPEYYGSVVNENGDKYNGETHIKFAKHRNGALDTIRLTAQLDIQRFVDFTEPVKQLGVTNEKVNGFVPISKADDEWAPF